MRKWNLFVMPLNEHGKKQYEELNFRSSAVITIDTQRDTLDGQPFETPGTSAVLPKIKIILGAYRQRRIPIVYIVRIYKKDGSNFLLPVLQNVGCNNYEILYYL